MKNIMQLWFREKRMQSRDREDIVLQMMDNLESTEAIFQHLGWDDLEMVLSERSSKAKD
jgi:hypothetical protein